MRFRSLSVRNIIYKKAITFGFLQTSLSQQTLRHIIHNNYSTSTDKNSNDASDYRSSQSNKLI